MNLVIRLIDLSIGKTRESFISREVEKTIKNENYNKNKEFYYRLVQENMFKEKENIIRDRVYKGLAPFLPKELLSKYLDKFFKNAFEYFINLDRNRVDIEKIYSLLTKLEIDSNFFQNMFLYSINQGRIGDNQILKENFDNETFVEFVTKPVTSESVKISVLNGLGKINNEIKRYKKDNEGYESRINLKENEKRMGKSNAFYAISKLKSSLNNNQNKINLLNQLLRDYQLMGDYLNLENQ